MLHFAWARITFRAHAKCRVASPIHQVSIVAMGVWILDNANLEELAQACRQRNRWEFLLSIGPLALHNTTGSPVNPIAIF